MEQENITANLDRKEQRGLGPGARRQSERNENETKHLALRVNPALGNSVRLEDGSRAPWLSVFTPCVTAFSWVCAGSSEQWREAHKSEKMSHSCQVSQVCNFHLQANSRRLGLHALMTHAPCWRSPYPRNWEWSPVNSQQEIEALSAQ